jgi:hypothetical protein
VTPERPGATGPGQRSSPGAWGVTSWWPRQGHVITSTTARRGTTTIRRC